MSVLPTFQRQKHFPIDIIPYLPASEFPDGENNPQFKDKLQIAKELFDTYSEMFDFSGIAFDSWYAATHMLEYIHSKNKIFFSEIKANRNIFTLLDKTSCLSRESKHKQYLTG